ncbi:MAG TPA: oxygen-independent coproporphyrinogen III oxidase [Bacteroidales bacterium]|nr:oxygen-independent coproporphyrinogen III oxidase [Bacteroidales bacterium]
MQIPEELLNKYNTPVPRYTSYPPANHFREGFTSGDHIRMINESNSCEPSNIAIYIHIPFCKKICYYCGCNSCVTGDGSLVGPYIDALKKEISIVTGNLDKTRKISQIHYGGGTPNAIDPSYIEDLNNIFYKNFNLIEKPEIAIECNPDSLDEKKIDRYIKSGFNRFSIGVQDFNTTVLRNVNRAVPAIHPGELLKYIRNSGSNAGVNFDFIFGLPGQTAATFAETIEKAADIKPDRLVTFSYAHVPWIKKHQVILEKKGLPQPGEKMKMFLDTFNSLGKKGYSPIGLDHFVLPEDDLYKAYTQNQLHRNFQGYCTRRTTGQVYAFGVTAISQFENGYVQNMKEIPAYIDSVEKGILPAEKGCEVTAVQKITREVINKLMCNKVINFTEIAESLSITADELKTAVNFREERLDEFRNDGLLSYNGNELEVSENGTMFIRNIAAIFDREYQEKGKTYSKTV